MSPNYCILIPSKIFQIEKRFPEKLQAWLTDHREEFYSSYRVPNSYLPDYSLITLSEFQGRPDVHLDLPEKMYSRYHVLDWGELYFLQSPALESLLSWLAEIYVYGEVGLLEYWPDTRKRYPLITFGSIEGSVLKLSARKLPMDKILFFPLTSCLIVEDST